MLTPLHSGIFGPGSMSRSALEVPGGIFCMGKSSLCRERLGQALLSGGTMIFCGSWDEFGFSCFFSDLVQPRLQFAKATINQCRGERTDPNNAAPYRQPQDESLLHFQWHNKKNSSVMDSKTCHESRSKADYIISLFEIGQNNFFIFP